MFYGITHARIPKAKNSLTGGGEAVLPSSKSFKIFYNPFRDVSWNVSNFLEMSIYNSYRYTTYCAFFTVLSKNIHIFI